MQPQLESDTKVKTCNSCLGEKSLGDFYARGDGHQSYCKLCQNGGRWIGGRIRSEEERIRVNTQNRESYERNKEKYQKRTGVRNAKYKLKALRAHGHVSCQRCGFPHPAALEFHHRDPSTKEFNIATAVVAPKKYPWEAILKELEKCDVICSNCHKIEHCSREYEAAL